MPTGGATAAELPAADDLLQAAQRCLAEADPLRKVALTQHYAARFRAGVLKLPAQAPDPQPIRMPGRPAQLVLVHPRELPRRGLGSAEGRAAFIHAIAHIELNAIDLAWDAVYRFRGLPGSFYADWVSCADDESGCWSMAMTTPISPHTTACGKCARRPRTTGWRAWRWCRACLKRAGWM